MTELATFLKKYMMVYDCNKNWFEIPLQTMKSKGLGGIQLNFVL